MVFLDDIYTVSKPDRMADVHIAVDEELLTNAQIRLHHGTRRYGAERDAGVDQSCESS